VNDPQPIRLLLADVDGTLVTQDKVLTRAAEEAAALLHSAGIALAITSGRPPRGMSMLIGPLRLETPIAGFNGGVLVNPDLTVIETHALEPDIARRAVAMILEEGLDAWLYTPDEWIIRDANAPHVAREAWTVKIEAVVTNAFTKGQLEKAIKVVGVSDDLAKVAACEGKAQAAFGSDATAARSQPYYLDVTSRLANKGEVVRALARRLAIPTAAIATIGDMPNDTSMFDAGGFSIAMGNASDEVKARADAVTKSNEAEGFAKAVEEFILPRAAGRAAA
jgi:Cof subfamily protein (haloacid dehalogenase superfamily)